MRRLLPPRFHRAGAGDGWRQSGRRSGVSAARTSQERREHALRIALPILVLVLLLLIWEAVVRINHFPPYVLPGPGSILATLVDGLQLLSQYLLLTLEIKVYGF